MIEYTHDPEADAIYIQLSKKDYAYGEELDPERRIDYSSDGTPIGIELLCVSAGVNLRDLPHRDAIADVLMSNEIKVLAS